MKLTKSQFSDLDRRMSSQKEIGVIGGWTPVPVSSGEWQKICALSLEGRVLTDQIILTAYPGQGDKRAKVHYSTQSGFQAARLEIGHEDMRHINKGELPPKFPRRVSCPHVHLWQDNRLRLMDGAQKAHLPLANNLPNSIKNWEEAVLWFITECWVALPEHMEKFGLPPQDRLL